MTDTASPSPSEGGSSTERHRSDQRHLSGNGTASITGSSTYAAEFPRSPSRTPNRHMAPNRRSKRPTVQSPVALPAAKPQEIDTKRPEYTDKTAQYLEKPRTIDGLRMTVKKSGNERVPPPGRIISVSLLGFLTPLYFLPGINPGTLGAVRATLLIIILLAVLFEHGAGAFNLHYGWMMLSTAYFVSAAANWSYGTAGFALIILIAACAGQAIAYSGGTTQFLNGFRLAMILSATATVLSAAGMVHFAAAVTQQEGFSGLSTRSTALAFDLAIAALVWFWNARRRRRLWWLAEGILLSAALIICGGRGGLVALLVTVTAYPIIIRAGRRAVATVLVLATVVAAIVFTGQVPLTVSRLTNHGENTATYSYSSGRTDLFRAALAELPRAVPFGEGSDARVVVGSGGVARTPHFALLTVLLEAGLLAAGAGTVLLSRAIRLAIPRGNPPDRPVVIIQSILTTLLVRSVLEGNGVLTGGAGVLIFSMIIYEIATRTGASPYHGSRGLPSSLTSETGTPTRRSTSISTVASQEKHIQPSGITSTEKNKEFR